ARPRAPARSLARFGRGLRSPAYERPAGAIPGRLAEANRRRPGHLRPALRPEWEERRSCSEGGELISPEPAGQGSCVLAYGLSLWWGRRAAATGKRRSRRDSPYQNEPE